MRRFCVWVVIALALCETSALAQSPLQPVRRVPPPTTNKRTRPSRAEDLWRITPKEVPAPLRLMSFDSEIARRLVSYVVYLPPNYMAEHNRRYPVIYMLPDITGDCLQVTAMVRKLHESIRLKEVPPMLVIGVQGVYGSMYTDSIDGARPIESTIINELVQRVDGTFRTLADREHRGIEGFDMGGYGAAHLAFKYPDIFGAVSIVSAPLGSLEAFQEEMPAIATDVWDDNPRYFEANDPYVLVEKNAEKIRGRMKIRLYCGGSDRYRLFAEDMHQHLLALGIEHEYAIVPKAKHNFGIVLQGVAARVFPFWIEAFPPVATTEPSTRPIGGSATQDSER